MPALGLAPKLFAPTASVPKGLGDGLWRVQLPLQFGKNLGPWFLWGEAGYQMTLHRTATDSAFGGVGLLYNFRSHLALGTELNDTLPLKDMASHNLLSSLGAIYTFNEHRSLKAALSRTLRDD